MHFYNFNDAIVSDQICADGMFSYFSNSYLIVTGEQEIPKLFAKYCRCRREEFRIKNPNFLRLIGKKYVRKTALNELGQKTYRQTERK